MKGRALRETMLVAPSALGSAAVTQEASPTIEVVGLSSVAGSNVDVDKILPDVVSVGRSAFSYATTPDLIQAMIQGPPFVPLRDQPGNQFQINLDWGGFTASPTQETRAANRRLPERRVYQRGLRRRGQLGFYPGNGY